MKQCPKCSSEMVEKALFTSTYWECEACERPKVEECAYETTRYINCDTGLTDAARYVNGGYQPILKPFIISIGVGQCSKSGPVEHHFVNPYASNLCACLELMFVNHNPYTTSGDWVRVSPGAPATSGSVPSTPVAPPAPTGVLAAYNSYANFIAIPCGQDLDGHNHVVGAISATAFWAMQMIIPKRF